MENFPMGLFELVKKINRELEEQQSEGSSSRVNFLTDADTWILRWGNHLLMTPDEYDPAEPLEGQVKQAMLDYCREITQYTEWLEKECAGGK